jgi:protein-S-isoprenylcysteine O-methyltransferase Ste14
VKKSESAEQPGWKTVLISVLLGLLQPAVLFGCAGRLDWVMGWVFLSVYVAAAAGSRLLLARKHPDLIRERSRAFQAEGVKSWDRLALAVIATVPLAINAVAGLDRRFAWGPDIPLPGQMVALLVLIFGLVFSIRAMLENRFFSAVVRIQKDRGHTVVATGPYRFIRHPGYAGGIVAYLAVPFMLDAVWVFVPVAVIAATMVIRTRLEDDTLQKELEGYREYAQRVRYRLAWGVW